MKAVLSIFVWVRKSAPLLFLVLSLTSGNAWSTVVQYRISTGNDDVEERGSDGDMYRNSSDLEMAHDSYVGGLQTVGLRFQGVNIPPGATINSAYVEFYADGRHTGNTRLLITGDDTGSAAAFSTSDFDVSSRTKTTSTVNWQPGNWSDNNLYQTADLSSIIKEIVDRGDWSSGNDIVIMIEPGSACNNSNCRRRAESYNGSSRFAPLLVVDFIDPVLPPVSSAGGSCGTDNLIVVRYASATSDEALNVSNYMLSGGNITGVTRQDESTFVLTIDGLVGGQAYTLTVQGNDYAVNFDGLMGHYYDQRNASGNKVSYPGGLFAGNQFLRLDNQVNFSWDTGTPSVFPNISGSNERFSIRWNGYISPSVAGTYEFRLYSDDGARLNLEGVEIINDWSLHSPRYSSISAPQILNAGQTYEVQMEHFEQTGRAYAQLEWRRDGGSWENIPTANLATCPIPTVAPLPPSVLDFRMDELSWNGTTGEVIDSSGNNDNGTARGDLTTVDSGHLCRAGDFDGVDDYIESNDIYDSLKGTSSMSFWIKTTQTGDNTGWRAPGIAGIEQSGGSDDIFWGWLDASGRIGLSVANDFTTKSTIAINDDVYHHIVLTRDATSGAYKIYIDGNLNKSGTLTTGIIGNSFSSLGRIEDTGGTPEYFRGQLDEVKIFGSVLSDSDVTTLFNETRVCPSTSCSLGSFQITQPTYGLACPNDRAEITIKAMCADGTTTKTDYTGTVDLSSNENSQSEFFLLQTGGTEVTSATLTAGEVNVYLFHKNENSDVKVTASDSAASISTEAANGTDFRTSGLRVTKPNDFVCGTVESFTVTAIGQDASSGGSCSTLTGFTGSKALKAWADISIDPATPATKASGLPERILLNDSPVAITRPASSNVNASFSSGVANVTVKYLDVGNVIDVSFVHDVLPYDGSVPEISAPSDPGLKGSTGSFVVYPKEVQVSTTSSCSGTLKDCPLFAKADEEFAVTGKAVCDNGTDVAKSYIGTVSLTHAVSAPLSGSNGTLTNNTLTFAKNDKGVVTESNKKISEVGVFKITSEPEDYFGKDVISLFVSTNIGRFYPDRFDVSAINNGSFSKSCDSYSYVGQPFGYSDAPSMLLTAKSVDGAVTENYTHSDFMKLIATDVERGFPLSDNLTNGADGVTLMAVSTVPVTGSLSVTANAGVMSYRFDSNDKYTYTQNSNATIAPFISDLSITTTKIEDKEGVKASSLPIFKPVGADIRYGRWVMENVFGPENMSLSMPGYLQYLTSTGYALNTDDKCSAILTADISSGPSGNSSPGEIKDITVKSGSTDFSYDQNLDGGPSTGEGSFSFTAPGAGNDGTVEISLDLSSQSWLRHDWDGDGAVEDHPPVTATFGRYRGHDRIIYWREVNN